MASTAVPLQTVLRRTAAACAVDDSAPSTTAGSPSDSPRHSPSSTSLSSLTSVDDDDEKKSYGTLLDTHGNKFELPDYTVNDIRNAIPKHCFNRSGVRGLAYVARDIASLAITFTIFHNYVTPEYVPSAPARAALWALYTVLQGLFGTGLWVLAHECGHQSFSPSKILNDTTGWFCHSALLVPYFSWKISHGKHHKATGHLERDMVFVPKTREQYASRLGRAVHELHELTEETPIATLIHSIAQQLVGWPVYITTNTTGHDYHERQPEGRGKGKKNGYFTGVNHFDPSSPLFEHKDAKLVLLSDLGIAITISVLALLCRTYGFSNMFVWYFIPYLWVNHWLGTSPLNPEVRLC
jgi:omega-6 fatty acid desaturase (delta-12 desaturase)